MVSDITFKQRQQYIEELKDFVDSCQNDMSALLQQFGWTPDYLIKQESKVECKYDSGHILPMSSKEHHEQRCYFKKKGYSEDDIEELLQKPDREENNSTVRLDKELLQQMPWNHLFESNAIFYGQEDVPLTHEDNTVKLTTFERASIYEFVVQKLKEKNPNMAIEQDDFLSQDLQELVKKKGLENSDKDKPKSYLEYMKAVRDYKRRRQSYRAKNVHITKKSYTEIIREVIQNQTSWFAELIKDDETENASTHIKKEPMEKSLEASIHSIREKTSSDFSRTRQHWDKSPSTNFRGRDHSRSPSNLSPYRSRKERDRSHNNSSRGRDWERSPPDLSPYRSRDRDRSPNMSSSSIERNHSRSVPVKKERSSSSKERERSRSRSSSRSRHRKSHKKHKHKHKHKHKS